MAQDGNSRKDLYRSLINSKDKDARETFNKLSFPDFEKRLLADKDLQGEIAGFLREQGTIKDLYDFHDKYLIVPKAAPQPISQPSQPSQPTKQPQSLLDITREQIRTPMAAEQLPFKQFGTQEATGQPQTTQPIGVLASDKGPDLAQIQRDLVTETPQEKQAGAEKFYTNEANDKKSFWERTKETGKGLWTAAKTQTDAALGFLDTVLNPMGFVPGASKPVEEGGFGGETNMVKGAKQEFIRAAKEGDSELQKQIQELGLSTDIVDAVKSGRATDIIQAINYNIGQMGYQVPLSVSTFGASSFAMEGAEAYKNIVEAQAREMGITPEELIEKGLDKQALGIAVGCEGWDGCEIGWGAAFGTIRYLS